MSFIQKVKNKVESIGDETVKEVDYMGETKKPEPKPPKPKKEKTRKEVKIKTPKFKKPELPTIPKKKEEEPEIEHDFNNDLIDDDYEYEEEYVDDEIIEDNEPEITYDHKEVIETTVEEESYSYDDPVKPENVNKKIIEKDFVEKDAKENYKEILDKLKISEQVIVPDNVLLEEDCKKVEFNYQSPYGYDITQVKEFSRVSGDSLKELTNLIKKRNKEIVQIAKEASILNSKIEHTNELKETLKSVQISHIEELKDKNSIIAELKTTINNLRKDLLVKNQTLEKVKKAKVIDSNNYKNELKNRDNTIVNCENIIQQLKKEKYDVEKENAEMMEALKILMLQKEENIAKEKAIIEEQKKKAKEKEENILNQIKQAEKEDDPEFTSAMEKIKSIITDQDLNSELGIVNEKDDVIDLTNDDLDIFVSAEEKMAHSDYNINEEPISIETIEDHNNDTDNVSVDTVSNDVQDHINTLDSSSEDFNSSIVSDDDSIEDELSEEDHIKSIIASLYDSDDDSILEENDVNETIYYDPSVVNELLDVVEESDNNEEDVYDFIDNEEENDIIVDDSNLSSILHELEEKEEDTESDDIDSDNQIIVDPDIINEIIEEVSLEDDSVNDSDNEDDTIFDEVDNEDDSIFDEVDNEDETDSINEDILIIEDKDTQVSNDILSDLLDDDLDDGLDDNFDEEDHDLNNIVDTDYDEEDHEDEEIEDDNIPDTIDQTSKFSKVDEVNYDDSVLDNKLSLFADSSDDDFSDYYDEEDDNNSGEELEFLENAKNYSDDDYVDIDMLNDMIKDNK